MKYFLDLSSYSRFLDLIRENYIRFCHKILDSRNCYYPRTQIEFDKKSKK